MNQSLTTQKLRSLLRPETVLLGIMLVGLFAWYVLNQQVGDAQEEEVLVQRQVTAEQADLNIARAIDTSDLQEEIEELQSMLQEQDLPTRQEALGFRAAMFAFSAERQLALTTFERLESAISEEGKNPSVHYSVVARGTDDALVGALGLLEGFPIAIVQQLEFIRVLESPTDWEMLLELDVFYVAEEAEEAEPAEPAEEVEEA